MKKAIRYAIIALVIAAIPVSVIGYNIYAILHWKNIGYLENEGIVSGARVIGRDANEMPRNKTYTVEIRYPNLNSPNASDSLETEQTVDDWIYTRLQLGSTHTLRIDPNDIENVHLEGNEAYIKKLLFAGIGDILLIFLGFGVFRIYRKSKREEQAKT